MIKPITPKEAEIKQVPDAVIKVWNEVIAENYDNGVSHFRQNILVNRILSNVPNVKRSDIFDKGWLNLEPMFRNAGWTVEYDKPGYNETYEATFTFKKKRTQRKSIL